LLSLISTPELLEDLAWHRGARRFQICIEFLPGEEETLEVQVIAHPTFIVVAAAAGTDLGS